MIEQNNKSEISLAQWQTCVEMANSISQRRDTTNNLFVTLNIALITAISFIWDLKTVFLSIVGVIFCIIWILLINNFKQLNKEKFAVISDIEKDFDYKPFYDEWKLLKSNKKYRDSTKIERALPIVFIFVYIIIFLIIFFTKQDITEVQNV